MKSKDQIMMNVDWEIGKSIRNMCNLVEIKAKPNQEYYIIEFPHMIDMFKNSVHEEKKVPANEVERNYETTFLENHEQTAVKERKLKHQATNHFKLESNNDSKRIKFRRSHLFHSLTNIKDMLILSILLLSMLTTVKASVTVNQTEIVVKKGEEVELVCTSSKSEALGCSFKSPAEHNYVMLMGAAYEEGRIQQKELNPNDCAMKITNIR